MLFDWVLFWDSVNTDAGGIVPLVVLGSVVFLIVARYRCKSKSKRYNEDRDR